jgi:hypothetical protein
LLQRARWQFGCGTPRRIDAFDPKCDDLFFDLHQHAIERLFVARALLRIEIFQAGDATQRHEQAINRDACAGDKQVDAFRTQQNRSTQSGLGREDSKPVAERNQFDKWSELINRNVDDSRHEMRSGWPVLKSVVLNAAEFLGSVQIERPGCELRRSETEMDSTQQVN